MVRTIRATSLDIQHGMEIACTSGVCLQSPGWHALESDGFVLSLVSIKMSLKLTCQIKSSLIYGNFKT